MADQFPSAQNFYDAEKDLRTVSAVSNSRDPDTGAEIDTWLTRTGGQTDTLAGRLDKLGIVVVGTTTVGVTLNSANEAVLNNTAGSAGFGNYYSWGGSFSPSGHVVAPGTDPALIGSGYVPRSDIVLRDQLAATGGVALVGNAADNRGEDFTGAISAPGVKSLTTFGGMVVGDNPFAVPGSDFPGTAGLRDAVTVSRKLVNTATDCHAFADKTIIEDASDSGTFGAFDCTTVLRGTNPQSHLMAFQNRADFAGANVVGTHIGYLSWPTATGTGEITNVKSAEFRNVDTLTATIKNYTGLDIDPKGATDSNVGILVRNATVSVTASPPISFNSAQGSLGYSLYAPNGGKAYNKGKVSIGDFGALPADAATPYALNVREAGSSVTASLTASDANGAFLFANGDNKISFFTNASLAWQIEKTAVNSRAFAPGTDNASPIGLPSRRPSVIYAAAGTINTSDGREKTDPIAIGDVLLDVADDIKLIVHKWLASVLQKGEAARWHFGVIAQQVRDAFAAHGLDGTEYGILCYDKWDDVYEPQEVEPGYFAKKTRLVDGPMYEEVSVERETVKMIDGVATLTKQTLKERRPVLIYHPVVTDSGEPVIDEETGKQIFFTEHVMGPVEEQYEEWVPPVFESRKVQDAGDRWGIRPDQVSFLLLAAALRRIERLESKL